MEREDGLQNGSTIALLRFLFPLVIVSPLAVPYTHITMRRTYVAIRRRQRFLPLGNVHFGHWASSLSFSPRKMSRIILNTLCSVALAYWDTQVFPDMTSGLQWPNEGGFLWITE